MAVADGATRRVALIKEVTAGTTPTTPTFLIARTITAQALIGRPKQPSNERRADRRLAQVYKGLAGASANVNFEFADDTVLDTILESALNSTFSTDVLKDGITPVPLTIEITDETGATDTFYRVRGQQVNTLSLNIVPGQAITGAATFLGMDGATDTAIIAGATYTAAGTEKVFCGTDFTGLDLFGLSSPKLASLTLNINNNLRQRHSVNSSVAPYPFGVGLGSFRVTGEAVLFVEDATGIALDLADTQGDVDFTIGVDTNKKYTFNMSTVAVMGHEVQDGGNNGDIMLRLMFEALHDAGDASQLKITRNVA